MKHQHKRTMATVFAGTLSTAALGALGAYVTTKLLVKTALDRDEPTIMKKANLRISGHKTDVAFSRACRLAAIELQMKKIEHVEITARDGVKLVGHFFPCENAKRIIIAFHGWRSSWHDDYGLISEFWHKNCCSVLYIDQRGQNNSEGEYIGFGLTERYDCVDWVQWVIARCEDYLPLYLAGVSMGAATVLMASDLPLAHVHGIMADCGFTSPQDIWKHVLRQNLHMTYGIRRAVANEICRRKIHMGPGDHSTVDSLKKTKIPVLFIHGTDDHFVPVEMTYENYKACASQKRLLIVPGADHTMSYYVDKMAYEKAVLDFWHTFDNKA